MADKGRDLKVSVLSDAEQFDLGRPADQLEQLGDSADQAGAKLSQLADSSDQLASIGSDASSAATDLERIGDSARDASTDLDRLGRSGDELAKLKGDADKAGKDVKGLGTDAKAAAAQVDGAFDKIAAASRRSASDVDKSMDKAGEGLDEFRDESAGTAREAAASFTGSFDDVAGAIQETMANAFAGFGPIGMAGGIAAAAGLGFLISSVQAAKEKVKELAAGLLDLKLDPEMDTASGRIRQVLDQLKDDGELSRFKEAADAAGIAWSTYVRALAGDQGAMDDVRAKLAANSDGLGGLESVTTDAGRASQDLYNRLIDQGMAADDAATAAAAYTQGLAGFQDATEASQDVQTLADALAGFSDSASIYSTLLSGLETAERNRAATVAAKTKDATDSWEDHVRGVEVSTGQYLAELQKQVVAQEQWAGNMATLASRGVNDGVLAELAKMGPQGAPLVAKLTKASDAELAKLQSLYARRGKASSADYAAGIAQGQGSARAAAQKVHSAVDAALSPTVTVPVRTSPPTAQELANQRWAIRNGIGTVTVPVMLQKVPQSIWSTVRSVP